MKLTERLRQIARFAQGELPPHPAHVPVIECPPDGALVLTPGGWVLVKPKPIANQINFGALHFDGDTDPVLINLLRTTPR